MVTLQDPRSEIDRARSTINLRWLVQLRWGAIVGQTVVILLVDRLVNIDLPVAALFSVVAIEALSNVGCALWLSRRGGAPVSERMLAAMMALDVLLLTALLSLSGGSFNPFNFLYLVHIALGAVVLPPRYAWALVALSAACFATLFGDPFGIVSVSSHLDHADQMDMHLRGMWVAFAVAAGFIVYFVGRIRRALAEREAELAKARERSARSDKLASLATLAAGAAHELGTPLGTIALAAGDMEQLIERGDAAALVDDARLIGAEVRRCRAILDRLSADAGDSPGELPESAALGELLEALATDERVRCIVEGGAADCRVRVFRTATRQLLAALVDNALDAGEGSVEVVARASSTEASLEVRDRGAGMPAEVLARAGEPFFTTKEPGKGMGLGLFLAHAIADRMGGRIELESEQGVGTRARLLLPLGPEPDATKSRIADAAALAQS